MPSPFPGMDPYLESRAYWRDFHQRFITYLAEALNERLPPDYFAKIDERVVIQPWRDLFIPDMTIFKHTGSEYVAQRVRSGAAVAEFDPPVLMTALAPDELRESFIEIYAIKNQAEVLTTIELLSPINKAGGTGSAEYVEKQKELLSCPVNLIEMDFLRSGQHTVAPDYEELKKVRPQPWDYLISLHRGGAKGNYEVWFMTVRERIPRILIPLEPGVQDVILNLQAVFRRTYDAAGYVRSIAYREDPVPPLEGKDAAWMNALLKRKKLRS